MNGISVLILTLDEKVALPGCLESCRWSDDIVVFDSGSRDGTEAVARAEGARFLSRKFDDYASQRMAALRGVEYRHEWVLMLDADERVEPELAAEMAFAVGNAAEDVVMFRMRRREICEGRWLRRATAYPTWFGRLVRPGHIVVERPINEEYVAKGEVRHLAGHLTHYPFGKGIAWWVERHNRYSGMEADLAVREGRGPTRLADLLSADPVTRRQTLKRLAFHFPGRPFFVLLGLLFIRGGILEGRAGVRYCFLRAWYEWMIDVKVRELRRSGVAGAEIESHGV